MIEKMITMIKIIHDNSNYDDDIFYNYDNNSDCNQHKSEIIHNIS